MHWLWKAKLHRKFIIVLIIANLSLLLIGVFYLLPNHKITTSNRIESVKITPQAITDLPSFNITPTSPATVKQKSQAIDTKIFINPVPTTKISPLFKVLVTPKQTLKTSTPSSFYVQKTVSVAPTNSPKNITLTLSGQVYNDLNCNNKKEEEETGFANQQILILQPRDGTLFDTVLSDGKGNYSFQRSVSEATSLIVEPILIDPNIVHIPPEVTLSSNNQSAKIDISRCPK